MAFGKDQDARTAGSTGGSARTGAKVAAARANGAKGGRPRIKQVAVVVESARGTDVVVVHEWKKHCRNCAQAQN
jgi:hypothetical protein